MTLFYVWHVLHSFLSDLMASHFLDKVSEMKRLPLILLCRSWWCASQRWPRRWRWPVPSTGPYALWRQDADTETKPSRTSCRVAWRSEGVQLTLVFPRFYYSQVGFYYFQVWFFLFMYFLPSGQWDCARSALRKLAPDASLYSGGPCRRSSAPSTHWGPGREAPHTADVEGAIE